MNTPAHVVDQKPLTGRCLLVTGASQGIGAEAAIALGCAGATLVLLARNEMKLNQVYDAIEAAGGPEPILAPLDLLKASDNHLYQLRDQLQQIQPHLDGLIHAAAQLGPITPLANYNMNSWHDVMKLNAESLFKLCHLLYPLLDAAPNAKVLGFTDRITGHQAFWGAYSASKAASDRMLSLWNEELENTSKIQCHRVYPGPRRTALRANAYPAENPNQVATTHPLGQAFVDVFLYQQTSEFLDWSTLL
jgi:short-subunit dehydrogenase